MTTAVLEPRTHQFDVEDIEYLRHGDKPLLARVFRPRGEGPFPALVECHGGAWCPERGEKVETPPAVWFQGRGDVLHDYKDVDASFPGNEPQRFVANYRKAGGEIALEYINADRHAGHSPDLSKTGDMFERMVVFVHRHIMV